MIFDTDYIDFFLDEDFNSNLTIYDAGTTDEISSLLVADTFYVDYPVILDSGSHNVRVVTELGVGNNVDFNVQ